MTWSRFQACIQCEERSGQNLRKGDIYGVIRRHVLSKFPYPRQKEIVRVTRNGEIGEIFQRLASAVGIKLARRTVPSQHL